MVKNRYKDYSFEELINDQHFIEMIQKIETDQDLRRFISEHDLNEDDLTYIYELNLLFRQKTDSLDKERKDELWFKIKENYQSDRNNFSSFNWSNIIKIAASLLILIGIGSILYIGFNTDSDIYLSELEQTSRTQNAVIQLASGELIEVEKEESTVKVLDSNKIQVNDSKIYQGASSNKGLENELKMNTVNVPFGKKIMLELCEGTKVWLNAGTKFAFPQEFEEKERKVFIDGEGYFEVTKNKASPFIVLSKNMKVEVLGTKFNIDSYSTNNVCETVLLEGKVNVSSVNKLINKKHRILPNEKAIFNVDEEKMEVENEPKAVDRIAWIHGWYKFSNEKIDDVLFKIGKYYNIKFIYTKEVIDKALPISGKLDLQDSIGNVMSTISKISGIEYKIQDDAILIQ